jgi:peptidoglycan-N-acetylglucosamine deacetylase
MGWVMSRRLGRIALLLAAPLALCAGIGTATASECPGHPNALGVSRTIVIDPKEHLRIGSMDYAETLPLADHEVAITFDDGPLPRYTNPILDILAAQCVKATYFIVGEMAKAYPDALRRVYDEGHSIGTHSYSHPNPFRTLGFERIKMQIDNGIEATATALGDPSKLSPFFRFPGFGHTDAAEEYAASRGLQVWGADVPADDWYSISGKEVARRAIQRLEAKGKGILLLHDIHERTVQALPIILTELKARGFRVVHVVATKADRPATVTVAADWRLNNDTPKLVPPVILISGPDDLATNGAATKSAVELCSFAPAAKEREPRAGIAVHKRSRPAKVHVARVASHVERASAAPTTGLSNLHAVQ